MTSLDIYGLGLKVVISLITLALASGTYSTFMSGEYGAAAAVGIGFLCFAFMLAYTLKSDAELDAKYRTLQEEIAELEKEK